MAKMEFFHSSKFLGVPFLDPPLLRLSNLNINLAISIAKEIWNIQNLKVFDKESNTRI